MNTSEQCYSPGTATRSQTAPDRIRHSPSAPGQPQLFTCEDLWQHPLPLLDFLSNHYGYCRLETLGGSYGWPVRYRQVEDYAGLEINNLADYITAFKAGTPRLPYLRHLSLNRALPLVRAHIREPAEFQPNWVRHALLDRLGGPELFIGQAGTVFGNLHQDQAGVHVGFVQLQGAKEIVLFPPQDGRYLYRFAGRQFPFELRNSAIRYADLQDHARFPLLRLATPRRVVLEAGQAMLLPSDWWHTTRNLTDSVSYNVRIINSSNVGRTLWRHMQGLPRWVKRRLRTGAGEHRQTDLTPVTGPRFH